MLINAPKEAESISSPAHPTASSAVAMSISLSIPNPVSVTAKSVFTMLPTRPPAPVLWFASHVWLNFAKPVLLPTSQPAAHVFQVLQSIPKVSANALQDSTNLTGHASHALPSVTDVKLMVFALLALTPKENLIKTVTVQLVFSMTEPQHAKPAILFVRPALTHLLVLHVSLKITEL